MPGREKTKLPCWPRGYPEEIRRLYKTAADELWKSEIVSAKDHDATKVEGGLFAIALKRAIDECERARTDWPDEHRQQHLQEADAQWSAAQTACDALISFAESENPFIRDKLSRTFRDMHRASGVHADVFLKDLSLFLELVSQKDSAQLAFREGWRSGPIVLPSLTHDWRQPVASKTTVLTVALAHCFSCLAAGTEEIGPVSKAQCWDAAAEFALRAVGDPGSTRKSIRSTAKALFDRQGGKEEMHLYYRGWARADHLKRQKSKLHDQQSENAV